MPETVDAAALKELNRRGEVGGCTVEGPISYDLCMDREAAAIKGYQSPVAGDPDILIVPDINAGNIGYKIAQRLGNFEAYGPILLGLNAPINDLSRGCNAMEVYSMAIITAALA